MCKEERNRKRVEEAKEQIMLVAEHGFTGSIEELVIELNEEWPLRVVQQAIDELEHEGLIYWLHEFLTTMEVGAEA
jgi:hypothetical protein